MTALAIVIGLTPTAACGGPFSEIYCVASPREYVSELTMDNVDFAWTCDFGGPISASSAADVTIDGISGVLDRGNRIASSNLPYTVPASAHWPCSFDMCGQPPESPEIDGGHTLVLTVDGDIAEFSWGGDLVDTERSVALCEFGRCGAYETDQDCRAGSTSSYCQR